MQSVENIVVKAPFPGLNAFTEEESSFFFGRERQLDELLRKIRSNRLITIVGGAGNGKTSLVNAMFIPRLREGFTGQAGSAWRIARFEPGNRPLEHLSRALAAKDVLHEKGKMDPSYPAKLEAMMRRGSQGIIEAFNQSSVRKGENLLIVIDRFEDIFTICGGKQEKEDAGLLVNLLLSATRQSEKPIYIVLAMRSEYIVQCTQFRGLGEAVNDGQMLVPPMKKSEIKRAIVQPIEYPLAKALHGADTKLEEDLVERILADVERSPEDLALFQHAMLRMWNHWVDKEQDTTAPITLKHYKTVGTVRSALSKHVEEAYADLDTDEKITICERLFRALCVKGSNGKATGRIVSIRELMSITNRSLREVRLVVYTFSQPGRRFLNAPPVTEIDEDSLISLGQDSLTRSWSRLKGWVNEEDEAVEMYSRVCEATAAFTQGKGGLWKDPELTMGLKWLDPAVYDEDYSYRLAPNKNWATRYNFSGVTYSQVVDFLEESRGQKDTVVKLEKEAIENKESRNSKIVWGAILGGTLCLALAIWALWQQAQSMTSTRRAERSAVESRRQSYLAQLSKQEAARQEFYANISKEKALAEKQNADRATLAAMDSDRMAREKARQAAEANVKASQALISAQEEADRANRATEEAKSATELAKKNEADAIQSKKEALRVKGLSLAQSLAVKSWKESNEEVQGLLAKEAYDMHTINGGEAQDAYIYEAVYNALKNLESTYKSNINFNALDQAPAGYSRVGRIRDIEVAEKDGHFYTVGSDGLLLKWKMALYGSKKERNNRENKPEVIGKSNAVVRSVALSSKGDLAMAGDAGEIVVYESGKKDAKIFNAHNGKRIWQVMFTPDSKGLISIGDEGLGGTAIHYTNKSGNVTPIIANTPHKITNFDLSSEGKYLAGVGSSKEVWIWNLQNQQSDYKLFNAKSDKYPTSVAFNPQGRFVAVGYQDGSLMIWDLNRLEASSDYVPEVLLNHEAKISSLDFSEDGSMLVVGSLDKTATIWKIRDRQFLGYGGRKEFPYQDSKFNPIKISNHEDWVTSVAFSKDGTRVVTGTADGQLKIWEVDMTIYADQICGLIRQNLSDRSWRKYVGTDDPKEERLYIETADGGERIPLSTCGSQFSQMKEKTNLPEEEE